MGSRPRQHVARPAVLLLMLVPLGGCIQAERVRFERHLTTVIAPTPPRDRGTVALGVRTDGDENPANEPLSDERGGHSPP